MARRRHALLVALAATAVVLGCAPATAPTAAPSTSTSTAQPATAPPSPSPSAGILPAGVAWITDTKLAAGTYWFNGFEPWLEVTVGADWEVGHFHREFFDLFLDGDFPSIGFGRFATVKHRDGTTFPATGVQAVIDGLRSNPGLVITDVGHASIAGLTGWTIDLRAKSPQTPLFATPGGDFKFDPEFVARFHVLEVEDGAMEILIAARPDRLSDAIKATQPVLDSLRIVGP